MQIMALPLFLPFFLPYFPNFPNFPAWEATSLASVGSCIHSQVFHFFFLASCYVTHSSSLASLLQPRYHPTRLFYYPLPFVKPPRLQLVHMSQIFL